MKTNNTFYCPDTINMYFGNEPTASNVNNWYENATIFDDLSLLFKSKNDVIIGIRRLPMAIVPDTAPLTNMEAVGLELEQPGSGGTKIQGAKVLNRLGTGISVPSRIEYLNFHVDRKFNTFLDYEPYTKLQLYLPLIGIVNLDTNSVMGKDVKVTYIFDYLGNTVAAEISVVEGETIRILQTETGVLGYNIPYTYINSEEMSRNLAIGVVKAGLSIGAGVVGSSYQSTSSTVGNVSTQNQGSKDVVIKGTNTKSGISTRNLKYERNRTEDTNLTTSTSGKHRRTFDMFYGLNGFADTLASSVLRGTTNIAGTNINYYESFTPTLTRVTINNWYPTGFGVYYGFPLKQTKTIGELIGTGFTIFEEIHVDNVDGATFEEKDMIENYLKEGVLL